MYVLRISAAYLCLLCLTYAHGQIPQIDSLKQLLTSQIHDTTRVNIYNRLAFGLAYTDISQAQDYLKQSISLSKSINYKKGEAYAYDLEGNVYRINGLYQHAIEQHLKSLRLSESIGYTEGVAYVLGDMGMVYAEQGNFEKAIEQYVKSLEIKKGLNDPISVLFTTNDLVSALLKNKEYDLASTYNQQSIELSKQLKDKGGEAFSYLNMGEIYFLKQDYENSLSMLETAMSICRSQKFVFIETQVLNLLAKNYNQLREHEKAEEYALMSLNISEQHSIKKGIKEAALTLSEIYAQIGDMNSAYQYQSLFITYKDSLNNLEKERKATLLAAQYQHEAEIAALESDYTIDIAKQKLITRFVITGAILLILIILIIYWQNRKLFAAKRALESAQSTLASRNEEIKAQAENLVQVNATKDKIFSIIGHDLKSPFDGLRSLLDLHQTGNISQDDFAIWLKEIGKKVNHLGATLENILHWAHTQLQGLSCDPKSINVRSIADTIVELYRSMALSKQIQVDLNISSELKAFADEEHLKLILRNLLSNAIKFTPPGGHITIDASRQNGNIKIHVQDSGVGIDSNKIEDLFNVTTHFTTPGTNMEKGTGIGLILCKEIIELNGGSIWVESETDKGTRFSVELQAHD